MANGKRIEDYFQPSGIKRQALKRRHSCSTAGEDSSERERSNRRKRQVAEDKPQKRDTCLEYTLVYLGELKAGPQRIRFTARVMNVYDVPNPYASGDRAAGRSQGAKKIAKSIGTTTSNAKGCLKILCRDDSGFIFIHLWYADRGYEDLFLGSLISVWTTHISAPKAGLRKPPPTGFGPAPARNPGAAAGVDLPASITTSIFPERDRACRLHVHADSDGDSRVHTLCRVPLRYSERGVRFWGLEPLDDVLTRQGKEIESDSTKVLVYVKAMRPLESYINSSGITTQKLDIGLADESGEVILTLFGRMLASPLRTWVPASLSSSAGAKKKITVLLISNAGLKSAAARRISITSRTTVEVDPDIVEAGWLRRYAENVEGLVNPAWPEGVFDVDSFNNSAVRIKFTLKDIDEFVRSTPTETFMGYASVIITEVNLVSLYQEGRLFCAECCNMPIFANALSGQCGQCGDGHELGLNPQIIGSLTDETGAISISSSSPLVTSINTSPTKPRISTQYVNSKTKRSRGGSSPLLWSPSAWRELLGVEPADLLSCGLSTGCNATEGTVGAVPRSLETLAAGLLFSRVTICFGWSSEQCGGKLAVCGVLK